VSTPAQAIVPKIHNILNYQIYRIEEITGLPMTVILDQAIRKSLGKYETAIAHSQSPFERSDRMKEIQDIAKCGVIIDPVNPQLKVSNNAKTDRDQDYSEEAANIYRMTLKRCGN
jgi:hypothetical protein